MALIDLWLCDAHRDRLREAVDTALGFATPASFHTGRSMIAALGELRTDPDQRGA